MGAFWIGARFALRSLLRSPGLTAAALLMLGIGIGAGTAVFSVVNAVLLRPLTYEHSERLVQLWQNVERLGLSHLPVSAPEFVEYADRNRVFERIASFQYQTFNRTGVDEPEQIQGANVSEGFFPLFGVRPLWGREFAREDGRSGRERVAILSGDLWRHRFGSDPGVIGRTLVLNGSSCSIVGVLPSHFRFPIQGRPVELWVPAVFDADAMSQRDTRNYSVYARLKPGFGLAQAQADVDRIVSEFQGSIAGLGAYLVPLHEQVAGSVRPALLTLLGSVGFVLLIACVNVASLLLARAASRRRETAIRAAMGAGRLRLSLQLLTESAFLGLLGGAFGFLLAFWCIDLIVAISPANIPRVTETGIDFRVLGFALAVSLLSGILAGLAPALSASRADLNEALKEEGIGSTTAAGGRRVLRLLVLSEVALALVLTAGAGLMIRSLLRLIAVDPGFDARNVLTLVIDLPQSKYPGRAERVAFLREALRVIALLNGVRHAGVVNALPFSGTNADAGFSVIGRHLQPGEFLSANWRLVSPDYFHAMGIPLLKGRYFSEGDHERSEGVAIVNATMSRRLWPGEDPLRKKLKLGSPESDNPVLTVVGIVADVKHSALDAPVRMELYQPYTQAPQIAVAFFRFPPMTLVVRATGDAAGLIAGVRKAIWTVDRDLPVSRVQMLQDLVHDSLSRHRFSARLVTIFAALALILAAAGIYSVMTYSVSGRTREVGIRIALGASPGDVMRLILQEGARLALVGATVGLAGSFAATQALGGLLFEVSPMDPATLGAASLMILLVTVAACFLPARRATSVDPMVALRQDLGSQWRRVPRGLEKLARRVSAAVGQERRGREILPGLSRIARNTASVEEVLDRAADEISNNLGVPEVAVFVQDEVSGDYLCRARKRAAAAEESAALRPRLVLAGDAFVARRLGRLSTPLGVNPEDFEAWKRALAGCDPAIREARDQEIETLRQVESSKLLAITLGGRLTGILSLGKKAAGDSLSHEDTPQLLGLTGPLAFVIENVRLVKRVAEEESLKRELEIASEVQRRLFPERPPEADSFEVAGYCRPARGVGGDYYDFIALEGGRVGIALADVAGKGISAALLMSAIQASLRSQAPSSTGSIAGLVSVMNGLLHRSTGPGGYATFFYALFDPQPRALTYVNAGHLPPMLIRSRTGEKAQVSRLDRGGPVIGIFGSCAYEQETIELSAGDTLVAYSDGISEAMSPQGEEFGEERLQEVVTSATDLAPGDQIERVLLAVGDWCCDAPQHDDMTLVVLKVK